MRGNCPLGFPRPRPPQPTPSPAHTLSSLTPPIPILVRLRDFFSTHPPLIPRPFPFRPFFQDLQPIAVTKPFFLSMAGLLKAKPAPRSILLRKTFI